MKEREGKQAKYRKEVVNSCFVTDDIATI